MDDNLKHLLTLGRSHYLRKEFSRAEKYLAEVVEQSQSFADVYNMLGVIYHDQGQFAKARRGFEAALRLNAGYTEAALNLAVIYNDMGKYQEAKEVYTRALSNTAAAAGEIDPFVQGKIANMYADIGDVFSSSGMWDEAIVEYKHALGMCPQFVDIRMKLAGAMRDAGKKDEAIAELEAAVESKTSYLPARVALGVALYSAGREEDAVKTWEEVLSQSPANKSAEMYLKLVRAGSSPEAVGTAAQE